MNVAVLGAGSWGAALACVLRRNEHDVRLWSHRAEHIRELKETGMNARHLPGVMLPEGIRFESDFDAAVQGAACVVVAVPSSAIRSLGNRLADCKGILASATKGIENETGLTMCGVLRELAPRCVPCAISGPSLALEVARETPAAVVAASKDAAAAAQLQALFHRPAFRVYTSDDLIGVELGGALKNVIAIAAGMCDGLGFGDNSKAALITRAVAEVTRLGIQLGAKPQTFAGLSGLGDLMVTCFSKQSRNRTFGERLAKGDSPDMMLNQEKMTVEGYPTTRSAYNLAKNHRVTSPIIDEVHAMLYQQKPVEQAVRDLLTRESKPEMDPR